ncbi:hypothetical protein ACAG39_12310 [Caldicellulosiruptoraceae bacterium PP1]
MRLELVDRLGVSLPILNYKKITKLHDYDVDYLILELKRYLEHAESLFNTTDDQDLVEIAIYKQILAEKWLNYIYKKLKTNNIS